MALLVGVAMTCVLPSVSHAHHNHCTRQGSSDPNVSVSDSCPEFKPAFNASVSFPYRNTPASVTLELGQVRHGAPTLSWETYLPKEWRFNTTLRPAQTPTGGAPSRCADLFDGTNEVPPRAEAVSAGVGLTVWNDATDAAGNPATGDSEYGTTHFGAHRGVSSGFGGGRGLYFMRTDGARTTLCAKVMDGTGGVNRTWVFPVYLEQVDLGPQSPYGWRVQVPVETIRNGTRHSGNPPRLWWTQPRSPASAVSATNPRPDYSITSFRIVLYRQTSGRWHLVNGVPAPVVFSRAPREPVQTRIGMRGWTCTNGAKTLANGCGETGHGSGAPLSYPYPTMSGHEAPLQEFPFVVGMPPAIDPQFWGKIAKLGDVQVPGRGRNADHPVEGFGFADGLSSRGNRLSLTWNPPDSARLAPGVTVAGYALILHKVTRHQSPITAEEETAGRILYRREVSGTSISFDLGALPENATQGTVDGKYNVSLVTIYNAPFGNGYRSDGLCDGILSGVDPSDDGRGVLCPANRPIWLAAGRSTEGGVSSFQAIVREKAWPLRYVMSQSGQPFKLLLMDLATKEAELTVWGSYVIVPGGVRREVDVPDQVPSQARNQTGDPIVVETGLSLLNAGKQSFLTMGQGKADDGASTVFRTSSAIMFEPTGPIPGLVQFGVVDIEGEGFDNWWFAGRIGGGVDGPLVPELASSHAYGVLEQYAPRNSDLDWLPPYLAAALAGENCTPGPGCGPEDAYPETITSDFTGTRF